MLGLAIHTSSPQLGLMLQSIEADEPGALSIQRHQVWDLGREVSSQLHVKLSEFIAPHDWPDLSFVAVAKGPGGFTGTRIGVVAARTLAQQLAIPLFGISSLAALAVSQLPEPLPEQTTVDSISTHSSNQLASDIAVTLPAKRGALYGALYRLHPDGSLQVMWPEAVIPAADWAEKVAAWPQPLGSLKQVSPLVGAGLADSVRGVMAIAQQRWQIGERPQWHEVLPFYGQHPVNQ